MFFESEKENKYDDIIKVAALLIHAARIDQNFTSQEEEIVKKTLIEIDNNLDDVEKIITEAKKIEEKSNQILDFTKEVKNMKHENKLKIVEALWKIIYSNKEADMYEASLMRKLAGLLYIDSKTMGDIKNKIKAQNP
tara:strand:+ start:406 stop:816 length:411 start_codon:yes stop_codon:yes gene_type:complete